MYRHRAFLSLLLALTIVLSCVSAGWATAETDYSLIEEKLLNGSSSPKDIQIMLENAWLNGYDHCKVSRSEESDSFVVEVAVRGLASSVRTLARSEDESDITALMQIRDTLLTHCRSVVDWMNENDICASHFSFVLVDDGKVLQHEYASGAAIASITVSDGKAVRVESVIEPWNTPISDEATVSADAETGSTIVKMEPTYILNTSSKKFHIPTCDSVMRTKEKNRQEFFGPRDELISMGYAPCGSCNP